jgi:hypothetical protein
VPTVGAGGRTPVFPQSGQGHQATVRQRDRIGLFPAATFAAATSERPSSRFWITGGLSSDPLIFSVVPAQLLIHMVEKTWDLIPEAHHHLRNHKIVQISF